MSTIMQTHVVHLREARDGWKVTYVGRSGREHPYKRRMSESYARRYAVALGRLLDCPVVERVVGGES